MWGMRLSELIKGQSAADKAYEQREARVWPQIAPYVQGIESLTRRERRRNFDKSVVDFPQPEEVIKVQVMPTSDGGFTVGLIGADGRKCTFWIYKGNLPERKPNIDGASQCYECGEVTFDVDAITSY